MSFPNGFVLTTLGLALQAKAQTGTTLSFTKMQAGDGTLSGQVPSELTALINVKISSIPITGFKKPSPTVAAVMAYFNNSSLSTGFYLREIGLFATDPDLGEILYAYGNAGSSAEYIPAYGGASIIEKNISLNCIIGNAANVSAVIDFSKVYLTAQDAESTYIKKSLATAASQFLVSSAAGQWIMKTVAEIKSLLGLGSAAYTDSTTYAAYGGTTTNTGNAYSLDYSASLVTGLGISFKCNADSTGAVTLNVNGAGAKNILKTSGMAVFDLKANAIYTVRYNGTNFILQGEGRDVPKISNLCKNGTFVYGLNSWNFVQVYIETISNSVYFIPYTQYGGINQAISIVNSHIYYGCSNIKCGTGNIAFTLQKNEDPYTQVFLDFNTPSTDFKFASGIGIASETNSNYRLSIFDTKTSGWGDVYVKQIMLFDLTAMFGAGNEPTKADMDYIVSLNGGWWDSNLQPLTFDATASASDIKSSKIAYVNGQKITGTNIDKKWASGASVSISGSQAAFTRYDGITVNSYYCTVTHSLGWQPSLIVVYKPDNTVYTVFDTSGKTSAANFASGSAIGYTNSGNLYVTATAFQLPINSSSGTYSWKAYE